MSPKTLAIVAALTAVAGCTLNRNVLRRDETVTPERLGGGGQVIEPKRCKLTVLIVPRPLRDRTVNEAVWGAADEQAIAPEARRVLAANGLRVGVITGGLPAEIEAAVHAKPPDKIDPAEFNLPDGSNTLVSLAEPVPTASLLLNRDGRAFGKDYKDAGGWVRVTASHDGPTGVALRIVPEVHHGPVLRRYDALQANPGAPGAMQFMLKDGQQEETLRDLAAALTLRPGQVAVVGCFPDRPGSLGAFLFTRPEANSDRLTQKLLIISADRTDLGEPGSHPTPPPRLVPDDPPDPDRSRDKDRPGA